MSSKLSWAAIRRLVYQRAQGCCEYCQSCEEITGQGMHIEHIIPDGNDDLENLCLSCADCNSYKGAFTTGLDQVTGEPAPLFHPRLEQWRLHFRWDVDDAVLVGLTPTGRATIERLRLNRDRLVRARRRWIEAGLHPPEVSENKS